MAYLQAQVVQVKAQLAQTLMDSSRDNQETGALQWPNNNMAGGIIGSSVFPTIPINYGNPISPQSSICSIESSMEVPTNGDGFSMQEMNMSPNFHQAYAKKRSSQTDLGELQALALRMMKN